MEIGDFFSQLWGEKAESERGSETEDIEGAEGVSSEDELHKYEKTAEVGIYKMLEEQSSFDGNTKELFKQLTKGILDYYRSMTVLERVVLDGGVNEEISKSDQARRFAHNALIDTLNALSRYFGSKGLDNEWRSVIGLERTQVTNWVKKVAPYLVLREEKY